MQVGSGSAGEVKSDINVTPLVDVCLVLLIIFMVVTPMLQKGVHINLPAAAASEKKPDSANSLTVSISKTKQIYIDREQVLKDDLLAAMKEIHDRSSEKTIYIKADKFLKYGDVKEVMLICNEAGFERVALLTEPRAEAESKAVGGK
jgi:biopolymer transport protein TolR